MSTKRCNCSRDYEAESEYFGIPGLQRWALATLNVALWDAWARTLGQPIYRLFGCSRKKIPVYGSGGWISYTDEELLEEVKEYQKRGFQAVKIKVGSPDQERDVRRLHLVRGSHRSEYEDHDGCESGNGRAIQRQPDRTGEASGDPLVRGAGLEYGL